MKKLWTVLSISLLILTVMVSAGTTKIEDSKIEFNNEGQIILNTITDLEKEGYLSKKFAIEAKKEFVFDKPEMIEKIELGKIENKVKDSDITWTEYLSLINIIKLLAILGFLWVFRGIIMNFIDIFTHIPISIYQILFTTISIGMVFYSKLIWES